MKANEPEADREPGYETAAPRAALGHSLLRAALRHHGCHGAAALGQRAHRHQHALDVGVAAARRLRDLPRRDRLRRVLRQPPGAGQCK